VTIKVVVAGDTPQYTQAWRDRFARAYEGAEFTVWADGQPPIDADYAIVWRPQGALFRQERHLKAAFNLGAGVDSLLSLPDLPSDLPIVRLEDAGMALQMADYVLHGIIHASRGFGDYAAFQQAGRWSPMPAMRHRDWPVGIMGLGAIGSQVARAVANAGYPVAGWSRSARQLQGIQSFSGASQLDAFLQRSRVLVNLLPLTPDTENILDRQTLQKLKRGGYLINVARGAHVVDEDLLALIDSGHLQGALLDVFRTEPLPADHPYWTHPRVRITPHIAAITLDEEAVQQSNKKIQLLERGDTITGLVARGAGY